MTASAIQVAVHGIPGERGVWQEAMGVLDAALHDAAWFELFWADSRDEAIASSAPILCLSLLPDLWNAAPWPEVEAAWQLAANRILQTEPPQGRAVFVPTILRHLPVEHADVMPRLRRLNLLAATLSQRYALLVIDLDRDLAHRGAAALQTDANLVGPAGQRAAALLIANVLLNYGIDRFVSDEILNSAINLQASRTAEELGAFKLDADFVRLEPVRVKSRTQAFVYEGPTFDGRGLRGLVRDLRARRIRPRQFFHEVGRKVKLRVRGLLA